MICSKCQCENEENAKYCKECGNKLNNDNICPVCSAPLNGEKHCPQCGVKIDVKGVDKNESKKQKADRIINFVANIISIVIFSLVMVFVWFPVVNFNNSSFSDPIYTILLQWKNLNFDGKESYEIFSELVVAIVPCLIIISNIAATYLFAIKGIVNSSKSLMDKKEFSSIPSILVIFIANVITFALMKSFVTSGYYYNADNVMVELTSQGSGSAAVINISGVFILLFAIYRIYQSFNRRMISIFVEKILFTLSCLLAVGLLINTAQGPYSIFINGTVSLEYGTIRLLLNEFVNINALTPSGEQIAQFVLIVITLLLDLFILVSVSGFAYLMFMSLFKGDVFSFKFKKPILIGAIVIIGVTMLNLVFSIVISGLYSHTSGLPADQILNGKGIVSSFVLSIYIFGIALASFIISLKFNKAVEEDEIEVVNK